MTKTISLAKAALAYTVQNGKRPPLPIFPLAPGTKVPLAGSRGFSDATCDQEQVKKWWKKNPHANIGIATGERSGTLVMDGDRNHTPGVDGVEAIHELEKTLGPLPDTPTSLTPNGGEHRLYKYPKGLNIGCGKGGVTPGLPEGIDIRANGGYIVAPPSILANGKSYEWEVESYPNEHELAELPDTWKDFLYKTCGRFTPPDKATQGNRNDTIFRYGCSLRAKGYPDDKLRSLLTEYNGKDTVPPLEDRELEKIIASVLRYPPGTPIKQMDVAETSAQALRRPRLTIAALAEELHARGYKVQQNVISNEYETTGKTEAGRAMSTDDLRTILHDALSDTYSRVTFDTLEAYISFEARENRYNPVLDLLAATKWDGENRLPQLYALVGVEHDALSQTLIKKWLFQTVALLFNDEDDPFGADGCLVLNGQQGVGKTSLFRHLALRDAWFGEGCSIDDRDKDTSRRVITKWISELGEVESTLKSDISKLKAFVSASMDHYRLPYGKSDVVGPRHTSLCATCNSDRYLIDQTGNRRWWSVPFTRTMTRDELLSLDALQLWAQIYALIAPMSYKDKAASYRLTEEEQKQLAIRNGEFEKPVKGQVEVADILYQGERDDLPTRSVTISEWRVMWDALRPYSAQQISAALKACGVEITRKKIGACAELPSPSTSYR